ncbi:MAG: hypothetical protein U1A78_39570 [Polyangia bacterium]
MIYESQSDSQAEGHSAVRRPAGPEAAKGPFAPAAAPGGVGGHGDRPSVADVLMSTGAAAIAESKDGGASDHGAHAAARSKPKAVAPKKPAAQPDDGRYHSPYSGASMSGIRNTNTDAEEIDREINGRKDKAGHLQGYGYGAYAPTPEDAKVDLNVTVGKDVKTPLGTIPAKHTFHKQMDLQMSALDAVSDIAAVTQYAAAADQAIEWQAGPGGKLQPKVDWKRLHEIPIQSNLQFDHDGKPIPGSQKITYDSPGAVADKGAEAVLENIKANGKDAKDKSQFISITGHSGGGQSSFYTALKLADQGYSNLSIVGVDMAMTPQERKILEAKGVKVTNITSNTKDDKGKHTSEVGEFIRVGMGGGDNFYDLNVERQGAEGLAKGGEKPADAIGRHDITNDANVSTMVRFAQYLDAHGKHGKFSEENYQAYLQANKHGDELLMEKDGAEHKLTADGNLMDKFEDNRKKDPNAQTTEADFKKWFQTFLQTTGSQMLPVPDRDVLNIDKGPVHLHYNPREDLSKRLGMLGSGNTDKLIPLLQQMGVDTTHIGGLDRFNGTSPSKHWGQSNPIDLPLPSWLHTDPVK